MRFPAPSQPSPGQGRPSVLEVAMSVRRSISSVLEETSFAMFVSSAGGVSSGGGGADSLDCVSSPPSWAKANGAGSETARRENTSSHESISRSRLWRLANSKLEETEDMSEEGVDQMGKCAKRTAH